MISICGCAINAKYEVESLVKLLHVQNPQCDFEICVTLDGRSRDGSYEYLSRLQDEYPNFKLIHHTIKDTNNYLEKLLTYYDNKNIFTVAVRRHLWNRFEDYVAGRLFDENKAFLWMSSGYLYNRAVEASSGEVIFITPSDFVYLFSLDRLESYIKQQRSTDGRFYASPPAIWARITNQDPEWLRQHIDDIYTGKIKNSKGSRWDSVEVFRDYLRCPEKVTELYLPDFRHNILIDLRKYHSMNLVRRYCQESLSKKDIQHNPHFHGFHAMTRKSFDSIGGFTEEFYGRAFADDKMTALGLREPGPVALPNEFAVAWCGGYEIENRGPGLPKNWKEIWIAKDPYKELKPKPGDRTCAKYLHQPLMKNNDMSKLVNQTFGTRTRPVRIF